MHAVFALLLACQPDDGAAVPFSGLSVEPHPEVATLLQVSWTQEEAVSSARVEYRSEGGVWLSTPEAPAAEGANLVPVLGLPAETDVEVRLVEVVAGETLTGESVVGTTGALPEDLPQPTFIAHDPALASVEPWLLYTVDLSGWYTGPWWALIVDRQGRVVWYRALPVGYTVVMSRVSADGTHLTWGEVNWFDEPSRLVRATLDGRWEERIGIPDIGYTYDERPDGTVYYDVWNAEHLGIGVLSPEGSTALVWDCLDWLPGQYPRVACGTNTVNWSPARDSLLYSLYELNTVFEIDPATGQILHSWGDEGADPIQPEGIGLQMQHYPNWTAEGTLLLSTQEVGAKEAEWAREFALDGEGGGLEQVWSYMTEEYYADCSGEAVRLPGGTTLVNYGCGAGVRELTPDGQVAWELDTGGLVGHQTLIADLYAVNRGL